MTEPVGFGAPLAPSAPRRLQVEFTGTGGEYFRIWIVNLLLTILTVGIYSAWAKVRRLQYFYRNTRVEGAVFDYHGRPLAILKGRIVMLVLIVAYNVSFRLSLTAGAIAALALAAAMPWLLAQSQRFRLHNSSYRGLRFRFLGRASELYLIFALPLLVVLVMFGWFAAVSEDMQHGAQPPLAGFAGFGVVYLVLLLLWPYLHFRFKRFQHANAAFGNTRAAFAGRAARFYAIYGLAVLAVFGAAVLVFGGLAVLMPRRGHGADLGVSLAFIAGIFFFYVLLLAIGPFIVARVQNHVWNSTRLGPVGFESAVRARRLVWIVISNLILIVLTVGLFTPFAAVRVARYKLQSVSVLSEDDLANFVGVAASDVTAVGEGAADLFDVDFAL